MIRSDEIVWYNVIILGVWHIGFLYAFIRVLPTCTWFETLVLWILLWFLSGLGITAGAHRLWSHKSYTATRPLQVFLMVMNAMAFQGSILEWSRDHRTHHKGSETDGDPHNASRGFFFAHCGWVMVRKHPQVRLQGKKINIQDLLTDPIVMFQNEWYFALAITLCYFLPTFLGISVFGSAWKGFWIGGVLRHVWVLHMTWCVNSVAHLWGARPYAPSINPAENLFVSICAIGEGWHNYHHKYPTDYATGEFGLFSGQWNPTKVFIDLCVACRFAYDCKRSRTAKATREKHAATKITMEEDTMSSWADRWMDQFFFGRSEQDMFH